MRTLLTIRLPAGTFRSIKPALFQSGGKLSKTYLSLRRETSDRHNMHTVQTRVSEPSSTHHHSEESGGIDTSRFHLSSETNQVRSRFILLIGPELHFDSGIATFVELDYRIDLQARIVTVMSQLTPQALRVNMQVARRHGLENEPERVQIALELIRPRLQACSRKGGVGNVAFGRGSQASCRTQFRPPFRLLPYHVDALQIINVRENCRSRQSVRIDARNVFLNGGHARHGGRIAR